MNEYGISKAELKKHNRICILRSIWESGPTSRVDISRQLHITRGAITILTNEMIEQNIIKEVGDGFDTSGREAQKGRRKIMLDIDYTNFFVMGVCVDAQGVSIGLTTLDGGVLEKVNIDFEEPYTADEIAALVRKNAGVILSHSCLDVSDIIGLGISIMPGAQGFDAICSTGEPEDYRKVEEIFGNYFTIPVYADNGITMLSLEYFSSAERSKSDSNRVFIFSEDDSFHMSVVSGSELRNKGMQISEDAVNNICVKPGGAVRKGYCNGSAAAELTPCAIGGKVSRIYGSETTPDLYQRTGGSCSRVTMGQLFESFRMGDSKLRTLCSEIIEMLCLMLNNILELYCADIISLCGFGLDQEQLRSICRHAEYLGNPSLADKIKLCHVERQHRFKPACKSAAINGFFKVGGYVKHNMK